ncbi:Starch-binding associating with outer membrane [Flavobacterium glycines]|uniref:Membrane protein n=2 Tax=Flavobacterium glycines TaxID=551990 RepID=A0A511CCV2_9FLAO|nr:membrane protein [Flavobacterium glycines]SDI64960.1 Starch-binding associating with outer membrane [Flavobacterium glycines]
MFHSNINTYEIMKTKMYKYLMLSLLLGLVASCSDDFLQEKKQYQFVDDHFYESEKYMTWYVNNLYYDYFNAYVDPRSSVVGLYTTAQTGDTEEVGGTISNWINPNMTLTNATDANGYYGAALSTSIPVSPYNRIRDCNEVIQNIDAKSANLSETFRNGVKGQMYYLRALQYYDLMRTYGGVPIVTTVQNATNDDPTIQVPRSPVADVVALIVADLDKAAALLPSNWDTANYGRFTKGAAMAQKSRVLLTYASPLFNKNWDTDNTRWQAALDAGLAAETQLTTDGYGLYGTTAKQWSEMFYINDNKKINEAITVRLLGTGTTSLDRNNSWEKAMRLKSQGGSGKVLAPKEMIDLFPMNDGSRPTNASGTAINGYNPFIFFKNRDPRFYRTFAFSGSYWPYTNTVTSQVVEATVWAYRYNKTATTYGYAKANNQENDVASPAFIRKMSNPTASNTSNFQYSGTDIIEYRYAELLLNIAECYAAKGDIANTLVYLGKIRNRVGIPSANNYGIGTLADKYKAIEAVLYERRVELAYEGKRFWDIQRWMLYNDDATANNTTCAKLGLAPINGTKRTGNYLNYKVGNVSADPLVTQRAAISVDPDAATATFNAQITALETFYNTYFVLVAPSTPMDAVNNVGVTIDWKQNYYISGISNTVLSLNPWLQQTIGWKDANGSDGTFNYQN